MVDDYCVIPTRLKKDICRSYLVPAILCQIKCVVIDGRTDTDSDKQYRHPVVLLQAPGMSRGITLTFGQYNLYFLKSLVDYVLNIRSPWRLTDRRTGKVVKVQQAEQEQLELGYTRFLDRALVETGGLNTSMWTCNRIWTLPYNDFLSFDDDGCLEFELPKGSGFWCLSISNAEQTIFYNKIWPILQVQFTKAKLQWNKTSKNRIFVSNLLKVSHGVPPSADDVVYRYIETLREDSALRENGPETPTSLVVPGFWFQGCS